MMNLLVKLTGLTEACIGYTALVLLFMVFVTVEELQRREC